LFAEHQRRRFAGRAGFDRDLFNAKDRADALRQAFAAGELERARGGGERAAFFGACAFERTAERGLDPGGLSPNAN